MDNQNQPTMKLCCLSQVNKMILKALIALCLAAFWGGLFALVYPPLAAPAFVLGLVGAICMFAAAESLKRQNDRPQ
jgi:hypothetical protein